MKSPSVGQTNAAKRASCDRCSKWRPHPLPKTRHARHVLIFAGLVLGKKKVKCDGKSPKCARCARLGVDCVYSVPKPMGRPRRGKICPCGVPTPADGRRQNTTRLAGQAQQLSPRSGSSSERSDTVSFTPMEDPFTNQNGWATSDSISSAAVLNEDLPETELDRLLEARGALVHSFAGFKGRPVGPAAVPSEQCSCACLASLYLMLDQIRSSDKMTFPKGLHFLREMISQARDVIRCECCPTRFLSATQNMSLVGALVISIARQYGSVLEAIKLEATTAARLHQTKAIEFQGLDSTDAPPLAPGHDGSGGFGMRLHPLEWMILANRAVKAEVYGSDGTRRNSFVGLLQILEERQRSWHSNPRSPDYAAYASFADRPTCIRIIDEARKVVSMLKLQDAETINPLMDTIVT